MAKAGTGIFGKAAAAATNSMVSDESLVNKCVHIHNNDIATIKVYQIVGSIDHQGS